MISARSAVLEPVPPVPSAPPVPGTPREPISDGREIDPSTLSLRSQPWHRQPWLRLLALTFGSLLILGYHPFVDDAAIYIAGVEKIVTPALFPQHSEYILPHLQHSLFSVGMGWLIRLTHAPLLPTLFATHILSLWLTLLACWQLSCRFFQRPESSQPSRWAATTLLAAAMTVPVAGTALTFMDPYLTARSFSTPVILFALVFAIDRKALLTGLCLLLATLLHPLMGAYAVAYIAAFWLLRARRGKVLFLLTAAIFAAAFVATHLSALQHVSQGYRVAVLSRSYFFLQHWEWYEIFGLFPPLVAAGFYCARHKFNLQNTNCAISAASLSTGVAALLFSILFVHPTGILFFASMQPLRAFHLLYLIFFLFLGGVLGRYLLQRRIAAWLLGFGALSALMLAVQLLTYPALSHVEWPWATAKNPWAQAFLWIRTQTPQNALFALDPRYQYLPEESTLGFRAMAERSALPDWSKDGGVAAIYPKIAPEWLTDAKAEDPWTQWSDAQRQQALAPYHVSWVVLSASQPTNLPCPYQNSLVQVCQLAPEPAP